ncbi:hypothetical protein [Liquorilactobacillus satsumensis]|uniref:hypothetical protein n=1 Tax=Liquorilactobacillus satsumensis TaxID=259059 RepID=UPI0039EB8B85
MIAYISLGIATLGAITGISGLLIQFFQYLVQKPKIKILEVDQYPNLLFSTEESKKYVKLDRHPLGNDGYRYGIINLEISNTSRSDVTVNSINTTNFGVFVHLEYKFEFKEKHISTDAQGYATYKRVKIFPKIEIPKRLNQYDAVSCSIPIFMNNHFQGNEIDLLIKTPVKVFKKHVVFLELEKYFQNP